jgi:hypothetical protein
MSTPQPIRRVTLAQGYRDLSEKQIRAKLEGTLTDVERVIAQAELLRRGAGTEYHDTTPGSRFAPTSSLDLIEAEQGEAAVETNPVATAPAGRGRRGRAIGAVFAVIVAVVVAVLSSQGLFRR